MNRRILSPSLALQVAFSFLAFCSTVSGALPQGDSPSNYVLSTRDLVVMEVYRQPDLRVEQRIDAKGEITVPLIGSIAIAGMNTRQGEAAIRKAFIDQGYLRDPQVTLSIADYAPQGVSVIGEVKRPGFVVFGIENDWMDIREVIAQSGGFTSVARRGDIKIVRKNGSGEQVLEIDFKNLISDDGAKLFRVMDGDIVIVPARIF